MTHLDDIVRLHDEVGDVCSADRVIDGNSGHRVGDSLLSSHTEPLVVALRDDDDQVFGLPVLGLLSDGLLVEFHALFD